MSINQREVPLLFEKVKNLLKKADSAIELWIQHLLNEVENLRND
jgi:hypothetical protein